jgi:hypothetical protein
MATLMTRIPLSSTLSRPIKLSWRTKYWRKTLLTYHLNVAQLSKVTAMKIIAMEAIAMVGMAILMVPHRRN